jgi:hypothetical protein
LLMRILAREIFAIAPNLIELNAHALLAKIPDLDAIHFISDSDDLFALSLTPLSQDIAWYLKPSTVSALDMARWWLIYDSPANDLAAAHNFCFHVSDMTPAKWRRAEIESDYLIRRLTATREILRAIGNIPSGELMSAKLIVLIALANAKLATAVRWTERLIFLVPDDRAMDFWLQSISEELFAGNAHALLDMIRGHVLLDEIGPAGCHALIRAADGGTRHLTWRDGRPVVDGVLLGKTLEIGNFAGYVVDTVLPPTSRSQEEFDPPTATRELPSPAD